MSKLASRNGTRSASAWTSGMTIPVSDRRATAWASWRSDRSNPTGRAPLRARAVDHWAPPQPNSSTSLPATSPRTPSSDSGTFQVPHARRPGEAGEGLVPGVGGVAPLVVVGVLVPEATVAPDVILPRHRPAAGQEVLPAPTPPRVLAGERRTAEARARACWTSSIRVVLADSRTRASQAPSGFSGPLTGLSGTSSMVWARTPSKQLMATTNG